MRGRRMDYSLKEGMGESERLHRAGSYQADDAISSSEPASGARSGRRCTPASCVARCLIRDIG